MDTHQHTHFGEEKVRMTLIVVVMSCLVASIAFLIATGAIHY